MKVFLSHLKGYWQAWKERHENSYSHDDVVNHLMKTYERTHYDPNRIEIYREWTSIMVSQWGRTKKTLGNGRQLMFAFGSGERYRVPDCLKDPTGKHRGIEFGRAKQDDWVAYLKMLHSRIEVSTKQEYLMQHLYDHVLESIFNEHPGIDTNAAVEIAVERGVLKQWREEDGKAEEGGRE